MSQKVNDSQDICSRAASFGALSKTRYHLLFYAEKNSLKISLKSKDEEIDRYELKLKEERKKVMELKARLPILEEGKRKNKSCYNVVIIQ